MRKGRRARGRERDGERGAGGGGGGSSDGVNGEMRENVMKR